MIQTITTSDSANTPAIITSAGTVLNSSSVARKGWQIQNLGTNPLFVKLGSSASTTVFHFILAPGTANDDGLGDSFSQMGTAVYQGVVSVAGTSPRCVVLEMN